MKKGETMSPKKNLDYKDVVGKLMSEENISIVHATHYKTASFDLESRTLYLPEFANVSENVYDLLIGHEVSHALHTPKQGWHNSTENKGANFKTFLNVVEDARIEKMIQKRFPGLKSSFKKGYKELYDMDLFGIREKTDKEKQDMLLIDRLNVRFKLGEIESGMRFKEEERQYIEEMNNLKTWDDVVTLAEKLFEYCKEEMKEKEQKSEDGDDPKSETGDPNDLMGDPSDGSEENGEESEKESGNSDGSDYQQGSASSDGDDEDFWNNMNEYSEEKQKNKPEGEGAGNSFNEDQPLSETDKNFRENEDKLNFNEDRDRNYYREPVSSSLDLPVIEEEFFYDDWRSIERDVKNWIERCKDQGW